MIESRGKNGCLFGGGGGKGGKNKRGGVIESGAGGIDNTRKCPMKKRL